MLTKEISSQLNLKINVRIRVRNRETGKIIKEVEACNRVTSLMLAGISNLIYGDTEILNRYVPAYIAVGYCEKMAPEDPDPVPTHDTNVSNSSVAVTDTMLYGEIPPDNYERIKISGKTITNNGDYVMVGMNGYIHSSTFTGKIINEVGLFTKDSGNNCIARVILGEKIEKGEHDVIDIVWGITSTSIANNILSWTCQECGKENNTGNFCSNCGEQKPSN